jgi:rhodanese-related sulfurtransferase
MIKQLASNEIRKHLKTQPNCVLFDVRTNNEWEQQGTTKSNFSFPNLSLPSSVTR